jgi:hypothetical protein
LADLCIAILIHKLDEGFYTLATLPQVNYLENHAMKIWESYCITPRILNFGMMEFHALPPGAEDLVARTRLDAVAKRKTSTPAGN